MRPLTQEEVSTHYQFKDVKIKINVHYFETVGGDGFKHFVDMARGFVSLKWGWVGYLLYFKGFPLISL